MVALQKSRDRKRTVALTHRDLAVLAFLAESRAAPLDILAARFFAFDPVTGEENADPSHACVRRLETLAKAGYVWLTSFHDGGRRRATATLGPESEGVTGVRPGRQRVAPQKRAHHVRTLDAVAELERQVRERAGRIVRTRLEHHLRVEQQGGRFTMRGERFDPCPDAACTIEVPQRGGARTLEVAVEYVTSKYTDADIRDKHAGFEGYDAVVWFADRPRTAERVRKITGSACTTLK